MHKGPAAQKVKTSSARSLQSFVTRRPLDAGYLGYIPENNHENTLTVHLTFLAYE